MNLLMSFAQNFPLSANVSVTATARKPATIAWRRCSLPITRSFLRASVFRFLAVRVALVSVFLLTSSAKRVADSAGRE
ncbi:hypothetical protein Q8F57_037665 [Paraburkholderia terrae]|uniref:hypothetical protein n=1 Tax=Paraburkholderia terrae TaxID=311230 RepID=UPI00296A9E9D|nr:hypothetical protein [Paraburkholderia terrae]MDW3661999.1 hypothetical protein [Paraburkholderia terrae]